MHWAPECLQDKHCYAWGQTPSPLPIPSRQTLLPGKHHTESTFLLAMGMKWKERDWPCSCSPLEVSRHGDLAVHQCLHHPADHLVEGPRHVLGEPPLKALLHLLPVWREGGQR